MKRTPTRQTTLPLRQSVPARTTYPSSEFTGVVLVYDSDEAGQKAAQDAATLITDLFYSWGDPEFPREPTSIAIAIAQRSYSALKARYLELEEAGEDTSQTEENMFLVWDHMVELKHSLTGETSYTRSTSADEFIAAEIAANMPLEEEPKRLDFAEIKRRVDILEYATTLTRLRPRGNTYMGRCPLPDHDDSTASFYVYPQTRSWFCFGCRRGGDVIDLAKYRGIDLANRQ